MEQKSPTWNSSLLKGLGATTLKIPGEDAGSIVKKFAAALTLAALAAMSSFAPSVAHASEQSHGAVEIAATVVTPAADQADDTVYLDEMDATVPGTLDIESDNPYSWDVKIPERDKGFIDKADAFLNGDASSKAEDARAQRMIDADPLMNSTAFKVFETVISPLDAAVNLVTDKGSEINKAGLHVAHVASTAMQYASVGPAALIMDGVDGVRSAVGSLREGQDEDHENAEKAVNAARERMAKIYVAERERMAAEGGTGVELSASRFDVSKASSQGLVTSADGMDELFKPVPEKNANRSNESTLSR